MFNLLASIIVILTLTPFNGGLQPVGSVRTADGMGLAYGPGNGWSFATDDNELTFYFYKGMYGTSDIYVDGQYLGSLYEDACTDTAYIIDCNTHQWLSWWRLPGEKGTHHEVTLVNASSQWVNVSSVEAGVNRLPLYLPLVSR